MSKHRIGVTCAHLRDHAREIVNITKSRTRQDLHSDRILNLAVVRLIEILGEAARRVPAEVKAKHPDIPWAQIVGIRHRIVHEYEHIELDIVWDIVSGDVPEILGKLEALAELYKDQ